MALLVSYNNSTSVVMYLLAALIFVIHTLKYVVNHNVCESVRSVTEFLLHQQCFSMSFLKYAI